MSKKKRGRQTFRFKWAVIILSAVFAVSLILALTIHFRGSTTYSKDGFQVSYPKEWVVDPMHYTAVADAKYREESGKEGLAKLSPTFILLSVGSNKGEYQYLQVSKSNVETNQQDPMRTYLDKNLELQKIIFPSTQEIDRRFFPDEEGRTVAQVVYTKDDPAGELGKLQITSRIMDGEGGSRWHIEYVTQEANSNKYKGISEQILNSFRLSKAFDWAKVSAVAGIVAALAGIANMVILLVPMMSGVKAPVVKKRMVGPKRH